MSVLKEIYEDHLGLAESMRKHPGMRMVVEQLYPDFAHFIYELLQNAEDTGATTVRFSLRRNELAFEHNGRPFTEPDIWSITDIGASKKQDDEEKIGRFGVGFKSVFAYSETPRIWSHPYAFQIDSLVLPVALPPQDGAGEKTYFEFPFNNPKKSEDEAFREIEHGLRQLSETTLLFLTHLETIEWSMHDAAPVEIQRIAHADGHVEVLTRSWGKPAASAHFLRFSAPVTGLARQHVSIAFPLEYLPGIEAFNPRRALAKQVRIVPAAPGKVSIFFPAEKEVSGLRFHLHAPFKTGLDRASVKDTPANQPLYDQLADLTTVSLLDIRDLGLLTVDFLGVLPNPRDDIPARYQPIREAIIQEMKEEPLTPKLPSGHAAARDLVQARASLKELLNAEDLEALLEYEEEAPHWVASAPQRNSEADRFLSALDIDTWDLDEFVEFLSSETTSLAAVEASAVFVPWLTAKPLAWHQQLYALLYSELDALGQLAGFSDNYFVRLASGGYGRGSECFFPDQASGDSGGLPRVAAEAYRSGRSKAQQENARKCLEALGVRVVGEAEQIEAILKERYTARNCQPQKADLARFVALVEKEPGHAALFAQYFILEREDGNWSRPSEVYLDSPFKPTDLRAYYEALGGGLNIAGLHPRYFQEPTVTVAKLRAFAERVGVQSRLPFQQCSANRHRNRNQLMIDRDRGGARWTATAIDQDWTLPNLDLLLRAPTRDLSHLLWTTLREATPAVLRAEFRPNREYQTRQEPSTLVLRLRETAWVPQLDGHFVRPAEAARDQLPSGFAFDAGDEWLKAVQFGHDEHSRSEEHQRRRSMAEQLGFADSETLARAQQFAALPPDEQASILADFERRAAFDLPDHEVRNPERRMERIALDAAVAPERLTEERTRSISIGREQVKAEADQYLREQYTNIDGVMICQICRGPLPFKLGNGEYYFEAVEFLPSLRRRHRQNYLALCPNHGAMYQHANDLKDDLRALFVEMPGQSMEIVLADADATVHFTQTHLRDMRTIVDVDAKESARPD